MSVAPPASAQPELVEGLSFFFSAAAEERQPFGRMPKFILSDADRRRRRDKLRVSGGGSVPRGHQP
jgi:hypothetical protein